MEPVAQRRLHLIVGILPPAIMRHLNIMVNESSLFLVLPTTQLNLSFLSQADFSIPIQDVSWIKRLYMQGRRFGISWIEFLMLYFLILLGEIWQYSVVPLNPEKSTTTDWSDSDNYPYYGMGVYGYATSGGTFFDTRSSSDGDTAWDNEIDTLDTCMGHSNNALQYHYHGVG